MKIITGLKNLKIQKKKSAVAIGVFDGVHLGHHKILKELAGIAGRNKLVGTVLTFEPHPQKVLCGKRYKSTIISLKHRLNLLEESGVKLCVVVKFTRSFSKKPINWFVKNILVKKLNAKNLVIGSKFRLGSGDISVKQLEQMLGDYNLGLKVIPAMKHNNRDISSSLIRHLIETGDLKTASRLLGRPVTICGRVVGGNRLGRVIGFKTANINPHHEVMPPSGVYAVKVMAKGRSYKGLLNIGFRPTFIEKRKSRSIEVHILKFDGLLYNNNIEVSFIRKIRPEIRFRSKEALVKQIKKDIYKV
ncbi:MAG: bifunctional riboflavin kinase/FAD synthetase [Candidatus Omnitrophica bacterium]|nr:bifunctional riboflavin kinase/FAD synthetase [Candidatus Omnitrophota bacterium]